MMPEARRFFLRLLAFFRADRADADLSREINAHLQLLEDEFAAKGMTPEEARDAAKRAFGGVDQAKENQRDTRSFRWLAGWKMDLKLGSRMLMKTPGITIVAVIALAVGIAAGATYLSFVNGFFRPTLRFAGGDRLVGLLNWDLAKGDVEDRSLYEFAAWRTQLKTVEDLGAARQYEDDFTAGNGRTQVAHGSEVSVSAFRVVPISPLHGRPLVERDEAADAEAAVVIGENLWRVHFYADPLIIGRKVRFGHTLRTVVGVMPRGFAFPLSSSFWTPLRFDPGTIKPGAGPRIRIFGRLAPGADLEAARAELEKVAGRIGEPGAGAAAGRRASIHPYVESFWVDFSRARSGVNPVFLVAYSFNIFFVALLGVCAANVAQLVFARTATRESEITIRTALGASRARIVAHLVAEALVLAAIAGIAGIAGAVATLRKLSEVWETTSGQFLPFWWDERLGMETIAYSVLLVFVAALVIGGMPALKATGPRINARLQEGGVGGATMHFGKLWTAVIVAQVATTAMLLLLLVSSGWAAHAQNRRAADVVFPRNEYLLASVRLEEGAAAEREKQVRRELLRRLNESPGVINATFAEHLPGEDQGDELWIEFPSTSGQAGRRLKVSTLSAGSNYFETFQQPLVSGSLFNTADIDEGRNVAVVDETFARLVFGGKSAIGQRVRPSSAPHGDQPGPWLEIVGVVKDVTLAPDKSTAEAVLYRPAAADGKRWSIFVHSRSNDAAALLSAIVIATDDRLQVSRVTTVARHAEEDAELAGFAIKALGAIAAMTLMLAAAGIHSLISFTLARRTREIGIRLALGAAPLDIVRSILSPTFLKVSAGIVLGSVPGAALIHVALGSSTNFRMTATATACVALFIITTVVVSSMWPVRRALKIQPVEALRLN